MKELIINLNYRAAPSAIQMYHPPKFAILGAGLQGEPHGIQHVCNHQNWALNGWMTVFSLLKTAR